MLYFKGVNINTPSPALALRQLFLSTLYHWFSATSDDLFLMLSRKRESIGGVCAVELLRSPFYLYVPLHIPTLLSDEMNH